MNHEHSRSSWYVWAANRGSALTKMHGAGSDFVVLDGTVTPISLTRDQLRLAGDRRFAVGADQILLIERSGTQSVDFRYRIFNNTGDEVEQCALTRLR